jgi:disulfide bond formation protein DsbB
MFSVSNLNYLLALGTVALQLFTVALVVVFLMRKRGSYSDIAASIASWGLWLGFLIAFGAMVLNTYYSDILGVEACYWCWWQRIFLYPQVVLFGLMTWKRDFQVKPLFDYALILSLIGGGIALYHHALQMLPGSGLPCPAVGVSCAQRVLFEFGYITYPLMAFSVFAFLIVTLFIVRSRR